MMIGKSPKTFYTYASRIAIISLCDHKYAHVHIYGLRDICKHQTFRSPFNNMDDNTPYVKLTIEICPVQVRLDISIGKINYILSSDIVPGGVWPLESQNFECPKFELNF